MTTLVLIALAILATTATAQARRWPRPPAWWLKQARCVHLHESRDWHWGPLHHPGQTRWNGYYGGFQFTLSTWLARGGSLPPEDASPAEQRYRAWLNWLANGGRWGGGQWPVSSRECGLA